MTDAKALEELAAAIYHLKKAEKNAESEQVSKMLLTSLDQLDNRTQEILDLIGEQEYHDKDSS